MGNIFVHNGQLFLAKQHRSDVYNLDLNKTISLAQHGLTNDLYCLYSLAFQDDWMSISPPYGQIYSVGGFYAFDPFLHVAFCLQELNLSGLLHAKFFGSIKDITPKILDCPYRGCIRADNDGVYFISSDVDYFDHTTGVLYPYDSDPITSQKLQKQAINIEHTDDNLWVGDIESVDLPIEWVDCRMEIDSNFIYILYLKSGAYDEPYRVYFAKYNKADLSQVLSDVEIGITYEAYDSDYWDDPGEKFTTNPYYSGYQTITGNWLHRGAHIIPLGIDSSHIYFTFFHNGHHDIERTGNEYLCKINKLGSLMLQETNISNVWSGRLLIFYAAGGVFRGGPLGDYFDYGAIGYNGTLSPFGVPNITRDFKRIRKDTFEYEEQNFSEFPLADVIGFFFADYNIVYAYYETPLFSFRTDPPTYEDVIVAYDYASGTFFDRAADSRDGATYDFFSDRDQWMEDYPSTGTHHSPFVFATNFRNRSLGSIQGYQRFYRGNINVFAELDINIDYIHGCGHVLFDNNDVGWITFNSNVGELSDNSNFYWSTDDFETVSIVVADLLGYQLISYPATENDKILGFCLDGLTGFPIQYQEAWGDTSERLAISGVVVEGFFEGLGSSISLAIIGNYGDEDLSVDNDDAFTIFDSIDYRWPSLAINKKIGIIFCFAYKVSEGSLVLKVSSNGGFGWGPEIEVTEDIDEQLVGALYSVHDSKLYVAYYDDNQLVLKYSGDDGQDWESILIDSEVN